MDCEPPNRLSRAEFLRGWRRAASAPDPIPLTQIAVISDACLDRHGTTCRACQDACEPAAIRFRPAPGGRAEPMLADDRCTGCGDCLALCPVNALSLISPTPEMSA